METENPADQALIAQSTESLRSLLPEHIEWRWDEHHRAWLAEFSVDHEETVWTALCDCFQHQFDRKTIKKAPPTLKHRAGYYGKLEKNQKLLSVDSDGSNEVMLAWWPWGHGATVSVRAFRGNTSPYVPQTGLWDKVSQLFS